MPRRAVGTGGIRWTDKAFPTVRAYFLACAERERAATRALFTSGVGAPAGAEYQTLLADTHALVERAVTLLIELVRRCEGLDGADAELARYALDLHELGPKNVCHRRTGRAYAHRCVSSLPLNGATLTPCSLRSSTGSLRPYARSGVAHARRTGSCPRLVGDDDDDARKQRLRSVFRTAVAGDPVFARAVDTDDTRHALDEAAEYDMFRDGFLVLPTLQSISATLPGEEDVDGLRKLLDPQTLVGRAARISLLSHGPGVLSLATSTPGSPLSDSPVSFGWNRKLFRTRNAALFCAPPDCVTVA
ncbi:hypothetical protein EDB89DRAFT_2064031 [Lactarius sanguifluus]|nr:hypothetical protein EDB89DRAFT_2064031 [Lactarius sanguifluus]